MQPGSSIMENQRLTDEKLKRLTSLDFSLYIREKSTTCEQRFRKTTMSWKKMVPSIGIPVFGFGNIP